jgi:hypothetical protein
MTNADKFYAAAGSVALIIAFLVLYLRFVGNDEDNFSLNEPEDVTVNNLEDQAIPLSAVVPTEGKAFIFLMELENCDACLLKGTNELNGFAAAGIPVSIVIVNDWTSEAAGWAKHFPQFPFYRLSRAEFYAHAKTDYMPVMLVFEDGKLRNFRFITL